MISCYPNNREHPAPSIISPERLIALCCAVLVSLVMASPAEAQTETVRDDPEANKLLSREYRAPFEVPDPA